MTRSYPDDRNLLFSPVLEFEIYFEFIMTQVMHAVHNAVTCKGGNLRICPIHLGNASQPSHTVSVEEAHV